MQARQGGVRSCTSPKSYKVKKGKHTFSVEAVGPGGTDATPATFSFKVKKKLAAAGPAGDREPVGGGGSPAAPDAPVATTLKRCLPGFNLASFMGEVHGR